MQIYRWIACLMFAVATGHAAATDAIESTDFSGNRLAPNAYALTGGTNTWRGAVGFLPGGALDRDYLSFSVPIGFVLDRLVVGPATSVGGAVSFLGVQAGPVMTVDPASGSAAGLLGWLHYGSADVGLDILPAIAGGQGAIGFTPPLTAGTYTFWVQDFSDTTIPYEFRLHVSAVPAPPAEWLMAGGLAALMAMIRRGHGPRKQVQCADTWAT